MKTMTMQDLQGMMPRFQNLTDQDEFQRLMAQQQAQLVQAAGQSARGGNAGAMNPLAMAMMLRKKPDQQQINAQDVQMGGMSSFNPFSQMNVSGIYGTSPYSQQSRMLASQESGMGFGLSPIKNMPVVGAYGQLIPIED